MGYKKKSRPQGNQKNKKHSMQVLAAKNNEKLSLAAKSLMKRGAIYYSSGDFVNAENCFEQVWLLHPDSFQVIVALAQVYADLGVRDKAIDLLERSLKLHGPSETLLGIIGQMAVKMSLHDIAEKVWRSIIVFNDKEPSYFVNFGSALIEQEKFDEAFDVLNVAVSSFSDYASLWNSLGVVAKSRQQYAEARIFFREAIRLDESDYRFWSNLASIEEDRDTVVNFSNRALALNPGCSETHLGLANLHFRTGFVAQAWPHWEYRLASERARGQNIVFDFDYPKWEGQEIQDKTLLVCGEQGIGDEVFFSKSLPYINAKARQLVVLCEPRLVSILDRSLDGAIILPYETETAYGYSYRRSPALNETINKTGLVIDYFSPLGSTWPYTWGPRRFDIPTDRSGYLMADQELVCDVRSRIQEFGGALNVGVSWRSQNMASGRVGGYTTVDFWHKIAELQGVNLFCLQYGDVEEELEYFYTKTGKRIHSWPDFNLKENIEANLAIMTNLDFVIGPATATQMFSMALGKKTYLLARGRPWWSFGSPIEDKKLFYAPHLNWIDNEIHKLDYGSPERDEYDFWEQASNAVLKTIKAALAEKSS